MERICPSCGTANPSAARFCMACASPLEEAPAPAIEERRLVTILFVDLVGFTERSDRADPEDVRRTLIPFHRGVKAEIERFGGTLDKFIGDAVMGVFGAPVAHEDDPERAVRAALGILSSIEDLARDDPAAAVRIAVNTGEAVVAQGTGPQIGEAVAGDVVNTASRMQSVAPRGGVLVGPATHQATAHRFDYEEMPAVEVKGKREPLRTWRLVGERLATSARTGGGPATAPMVGREEEVALLEDLFAAAERGEAAARIVSLLGEPGMGKSRLLQEFQGRVGSRATWLAGACLPYGEDVAFRALADVLRAAVGVSPGDDAEASRRKVAAIAGRIESAPAERDWLATRLDALLAPSGGAGVTAGAVPPEEWAAATARVLSAVAAERPAVVVFEDVHWAEPALRETIRRVAAGLSDRPVVVVTTGRPGSGEDEAGGWGDAPSATTIRLAELTGDETAAVLAASLDRSALSDQAREAVLSRAAGNPLYALEFGRMLTDAPEGAIDPDHIPVPETVQAVIGARLDAVPADLRRIAQDAAVVGASFWPGALAEPCGRTDADVARSVDDLVARGVFVEEPGSHLAGHPELSFGHALYREVAYGRLPRLSRARKHLAAGRWLETAAGGRAADHADAIAHHYAQAAELAAAAGAEEERAAAVGPAVRWLLAAAEGATRIDEGSARALFERALTLAPEGSHERATALLGSGLMGRRSGALPGREVLSRFQAALVIERALGEPLALGSTLVRVGSQLGALGETGRAREALAEAVEVLATRPPGPELARALAFRAEEDMFAGRTEGSLALADQALTLARRVGADDTAIIALHIRGDARCASGDVGGLDDLREAIRLAETVGTVSDLVTSMTYLGEWVAAFEGPRAALPHFEDAIAMSTRRGAASQGQWTRATAAWSLLEAGQWGTALAWCEELLSLGPDHLDLTVFSVARTVRAAALMLLGRGAEAGLPEDLVEPARRTEELQAIAPALVVAAVLARTRSDDATARSLVEEFERATRGLAPEYRAAHLTDAVRTAADLGDVALAEGLVASTEARTVRDHLNLDTARAVLAEARGDAAAAAAGYADAAPRWRGFGQQRQEAEALLGLARSLRAVGPDREGDAARAEAEGEAILARLAARSAG